jgi:hypothetical protein
MSCRQPPHCPHPCLHAFIHVWDITASTPRTVRKSTLRLESDGLRYTTLVDIRVSDGKAAKKMKKFSALISTSHMDVPCDDTVHLILYILQALCVEQAE